MTKLYTLASGMLLVAACSESSSDPALEAARETGREICRRYLDCVIETTPEVAATLLPSYGPEGECWASDNIEVIELCTITCIKALENYTELYTDVAACGECQDDSHCTESASRPRCATESHECVECTANSDCESGTCNTATHQCAECTTNADCESGACDTQATRCVQCLEDSHCASNNCNEAEMRCVECIFDAQCPSGTCDTKTSTCVG